MIIDGILLIVQGVIEVILLPLTALNITIDFLASIPVVYSFLQVVFYILPFSNITPLIVVVVGILVFKISVSVVKVMLAVVLGHGAW